MNVSSKEGEKEDNTCNGEYGGILFRMSKIYKNDSEHIHILHNQRINSLSDLTLNKPKERPKERG